MTDERAAEDEDDAAEELERRRDADHLRLLVVVLVVYTPFAIAPLFSGLFSTLWRAAFQDAATCLLVVRSFVAVVATPVVAWLVATRRARTLCVVLAFLIASDATAGTIVGVALLLVLARPSVAELFEEAAEVRRRYWN